MSSVPGSRFPIPTSDSSLPDSPSHILTPPIGYATIVSKASKSLGINPEQIAGQRGLGMRVSTRGEYGVRAMLDLACYYGNGPVLLKDIARRQEVSLKYLDGILSTLKAAGLVKTLRGARGGYTLNHEPSKITVKQIVEALEGSLVLVECVKEKTSCNRVDSCITHDIWCELGKAMETVLKTTTLEDLVIRDNAKKKTAKMYYI